MGAKTSINIDFSVRNLNILTSIYNCGYSFLLADEIYPHRTTNQLVEETGLAPYSVEKLIELTQKATQSEKNIYSYMLSAINKIISCENLLNILYRFLILIFKTRILNGFIVLNQYLLLVFIFQKYSTSYAPSLRSHKKATLNIQHSLLIHIQILLGKNYVN